MAEQTPPGQPSDLTQTALAEDGARGYVPRGVALRLDPASGVASPQGADKVLGE